jgi:hypothetical protein
LVFANIYELSLNECDYFDSISLAHIVIPPNVSHIVDRLQNPSMIFSMSFSYKIGIASKDVIRKVKPNGEPFM